MRIVAPRPALLLALVALLLVGCQLVSSSPQLVVVLVVDQMRPDYLERFADDWQHGLKRLLEQGRIYEDSLYDYAITATGCGHATISTGTQPSQHGYVGNSWWDHGSGEYVACSHDANEQTLLGVDDAHSPRRLLRTGVGDWLQQASPSSQVIAIADKARSAVALGGQRPNWAIWRHRRDYASSSYYGDSAPAWLQRFSEEHDIPLDSRNGLAADESSLFALGLVAVDELSLGGDGAPDLLLLGASVADYVGHAFGPRSPEVRAYYQGLDRELGDFLAELDRRDLNYRLLLSSDHGVADLPEDSAAEGLGAQRIVGADFDAQLDSLGDRVREAAGLSGDAFVRGNFFGVVYSDELRAAMDPALRDFVVAELANLPSVAGVYALDGSVGDDEYSTYFRNSFHSTRGYDLYLRHREHWLVGIGATGTNHGSCYRYDRHVPLILFGQGIEAGRVSETVHQIQIAPTLARWLGAPPPPDLPAAALPQ